VIPLALWHTASTGLDVWLSAIAFGASQVVVLVTAEEAPQYLDGLQAQMAVAQAILNGLGYTGTHLQLLRAGSHRSGRRPAGAGADPPAVPPRPRALPSWPKSAARWSWRWTT
jgi:hypothetical protein